MVEDSVSEYTLVNGLLQKLVAKGDPDYQGYELIWAESLGGAKVRLSQESFDMILTDLALPDANGMECLSTIQSVAPHIPLVVLAKERDTQLLHQALQNGAQDYLVKGEYDSERLARSLQIAIERHRLLRQLETESHFKSELVSTMSDDLRAPMTAIIELAEQIREGSLPEDVVAKLGEGIVESGHRMLSILEDVVNMANANVRRIMLQSRPCSILLLLNEVERMMKPRAQEKKLAFGVSKGLPLPRSVVTDPGRLKQVVSNLVDNAIRFTHEGSVELSVQLDVENAELVFLVSDTGIGITKEKLVRIFGTDEEKKKAADSVKTSAFGLSLTNKIAQSLGGKLRIESAPGRGTHAELRLPTGVVRSLELVTEEELQSDARLQLDPLIGKLVYLVDKPHRLPISQKLRQMSLQSTPVEDARSILPTAIEFDATGIIIDLDVTGANACDVVKHIRAHGFPGFIIGLVNVGSTENLKGYMQAGCDRYITKPLDWMELYSNLKELTAVPEESDSSAFEIEIDSNGQLRATTPQLGDLEQEEVKEPRVYELPDDGDHGGVRVLQNMPSTSTYTEPVANTETDGHYEEFQPEVIPAVTSSYGSGLTQVNQVDNVEHSEASYEQTYEQTSPVTLPYRELQSSMPNSDSVQANIEAAMGHIDQYGSGSAQWANSGHQDQVQSAPEHSIDQSESPSTGNSELPLPESPQHFVPPVDQRAQSEGLAVLVEPGSTLNQNQRPILPRGLTDHADISQTYRAVEVEPPMHHPDPGVAPLSMRPDVSRWSEQEVRPSPAQPNPTLNFGPPITQSTTSPVTGWSEDPYAVAGVVEEDLTPLSYSQNRQSYQPLMPEVIPHPRPTPEVQLSEPEVIETQTYPEPERFEPPHQEPVYATVPVVEHPPIPEPQHHQAEPVEQAMLEPLHNQAATPVPQQPPSTNSPREVFITHFPQHLSALSEAASLGSWITVRMLAKSLAREASAAGVLPVSEIAKAVEAAAQQGSDEVHDYLQALAELAARVR